MENKYYTPELSEFHVGFEYEEYQFLERNWKIVKCEFIKPDTIIDPKWFRVKYLDQSDIENLGLNGFEITEYVEESHLEFTWFKGIELFGLLTFTDKMISFYEYNYSTREYSDCIFRGTIKNKSELIKLMQQLNIK